MSNRDHDTRLNVAYADLARKYCADPNSVSQAELDALPKTRGTDALHFVPAGLVGCAQSLHVWMKTGPNAEQIKSYLMPGSVHDAPPAVPIYVAPAAPHVPVYVAGARPQTSFRNALPQLKGYAVNACALRGGLAIDTSLFAPRQPYIFDSSDAQEIATLSSSLGGCELLLFQRLAEVIQNGQGGRIGARWLEETVASFRPPESLQGAVVPPTSGNGNRGGCWRGNDPFGCQTPHF